MKQKKPRILIAEDERNTRQILERFLRKDYSVTLAEDGIIAINLLKKNDYDIVLTDLKMPGADGMEVLKSCLNKKSGHICIVFTAYGSIETAVDAVKAGAFDFVTKPVNFDRLELLFKRAFESQRLENENADLKKQLKSKNAPSNIIANSVEMKSVIEMTKQVAPTKSTVLITGESGTGKEMIAHALHEFSGRSGRFIPVHCAALPANLLESELFGHEKGAFTGAAELRKGRFEVADGGTLFLDEIGEIDSQTQVKLLRCLETKSFERVGGVDTIVSDVRVIAATNRNLKKMVGNGEFREDLFYRLDVVTIPLPPLRDRPDDIPALVKNFIDEFSSQNNKEISGITDEAMEALCTYKWPGNIRELRNCIERMTVLSRSEQIDISCVPANVREGVSGGITKSIFNSSSCDLNKNERFLIIKALESCDGNRSKAAEKLGISRRTLYRKLDRYNLT